jgi:hypothetical protein
MDAGRDTDRFFSLERARARAALLAAFRVLNLIKKKSGAAGRITENRQRPPLIDKKYRFFSNN